MTQYNPTLKQAETTNLWFCSSPDKWFDIKSGQKSGEKYQVKVSVCSQSEA
jgi:hypothetical protein